MHEIPLLAGKTLGCWCKPNPCHGDVLVKLVQEHLEMEEYEEVPDIDEDDNSTSEDSEQHECSQHTKPASVSTEGVTIGTTHIKPPHVCVIAISGGKLIRPLPSFNIVQSDSLARVGTKFWFSYDEERVHKRAPLPHYHKDIPVNITQIDPKPVHPQVLYQMIASCAVSKVQSKSAHELLKLLTDNRRHSTQTLYVFEGSHVHSSIITKVESDIVIYLKDVGKRPRVQFHALGNEFHLPVTSVGMIKMFVNSKEKKLIFKQKNVDFVCVSLARPYLPWLSSHLDIPRCYAVFTGAVVFIDNNVTIL